jgi:hypothetical protein
MSIDSQGREDLLKGGLCMVDLIVPTTLDQPIFILKKMIDFFTKQAALIS